MIFVDSCSLYCCRKNQEKILSTSKVSSSSGDIVISFDESKINDDQKSDSIMSWATVGIIMGIVVLTSVVGVTIRIYRKTRTNPEINPRNLENPVYEEQYIYSQPLKQDLNMEPYEIPIIQTHV